MTGRLRIFTANSFLVLSLFLGSCKHHFLQDQLLSDKDFCADEELMEKAQTYFKPIEPLSALSDVDAGEFSFRVELGEELFKSVLLSQNKSQSCNTCHPLDAHGMDGKRFSEGAFGDLGTRNTPTVYNAVFNLAQFWDGRAANLEEQALVPIFNPKEMAMKDSTVLLKRLHSDSKLSSLFAKAFPEEDEPICLSNLAKALAAFQATLVTPGPFDAYLRGNEQALSEEEKKGLAYFLDLGCSPCHSGVGVGGSMYQPFGLLGYYWHYTGSESRDEGRYLVTGDVQQRYWFKVPSLRNVEHTAPYFHDGSVENLAEAVRAMAAAQLNRNLEEEEVRALLAFLKTL